MTGAPPVVRRGPAVPGKSPKFSQAGTFYGDDVTLAAVVGGAATGSAPVMLSADYHTLRLNATGVSFTGGTTPTVTPIVETSGDGTTWASLNPVSGSFPALAAGTTARAVFTGLDRYTRVRWTTTGTPTAVNFTVNGEAV
jgi:hypothetical protein